MKHVGTIRRVLLLTTDTGEGHNACARAMAEYLAEQGIAADVLDGLSLVSHGYSHFLSRGHSFVYRHTPRLFEVGWRFCDRHPRMFEKGSVIFRKLVSGVDRLYETVRAGGYDTVISVHGLTAVLLTEMQRRYALPIQTAFIATDYTGYPCMHMTDLDLYLLPDEELFEVYERSGISRERMRVGSIPVRRAFHKDMDQMEVRRELGLDPACRQLLVMGGSMGCGPMEKILARIVRSMAEDVELTVICGRNKRLRRRLSRRYQAVPTVHVTGYCDRVPRYMAAADVYLTKPGGISVSEATAMGLPMVLVRAVGGCEQFNLTRFLAVGGAVTADGPDRLAALCLTVLADRETRGQMQDSLRSHTPPDGAVVLLDALRATERAPILHGGDL